MEKKIIIYPGRYIKLMALLLLISNTAIAQDDLTPEEIFRKARIAAYEEKDYSKAISLVKEAISKNPENTDYTVFLGRAYSWSGEADKAREIFDDVLQKQSRHEDAFVAYVSLEYWNQNHEKALDLVEDGLLVNSQSQELLLLKAKILRALKRYSEANTVINQLLKINPKLTEARSLGQSLISVAINNAIGARYDYVYFDKRFDDPWHLANIDYTRQTKIGLATARVNYANRFNTGAAQFEIDLYPRFSNMFYAYINGGISDDRAIFPKYRTGFSLYANLPAAFEADAGFRQLNFINENIWIYTASIGKYYKNFWFNFRAYITPSHSNVSQAYSLSGRYYIGGADDYFGIRMGTGISADNKTNNVFYNSSYKLKSKNIAVEYRTVLNRANVLFIQASLENQEYERDTTGDQIIATVGYIIKF